MKKAVFLIAAVSLALVFGSCQNKQDVVKIGAVFPLTGSGAYYGQSLKQGVDLAVEVVNATGGINGRRLEVIYEDSRTDPRTGVSGFNKLTTMDRVPLVLSSMSGVILAIQPEADRQGVVLINTSAISPLICENADNFLFNFLVNGEQEAIFMANKFQETYPNEQIAVIYINNPSGVGMKDGFIRNLNQLGNSNIVVESFEPNAVDFRIQLDRIKRSGAKFGYLIAFANNEFAEILKQTKELALDLQWFSFSGIETRETIELAREAANGVIYSYPQLGADETLFSNLQTKYNARHNSWADIYNVTTYDGIHLIAKVMREYGTTAVDIQRGLRSVQNFNGIFGNIKLSDAVGKQCVDRELIWKTIENGQFKIQK
jgi:branched-chain amino acid transport system substrate-binding protein